MANSSNMLIHQKPWPLVSRCWSAPDQGSGQCGMKAGGAKNHWNGPGCRLLLTLATYNGRSLASEAKLQELEEELEKIKWDIVGLSEVRRKGEELVELKSGHLFYYRGTETGRTSGVGFLINKRIKDYLLEVESTSDRAARLVVQLTQRYQLQIVQAYAPTSSHTDEEVEEFYEEIKQLHTKGKQHIKLIMGDFNARIGQQEQGETSVGKYGYGERNERGDQLIEFAEAENLSIMNSFFKKKLQRKWTWKHPNGGTSEIDYILANKKSIIEDCSVLNRFNTGSDHRMVRCKMHLNTKLERQKLIRKQVCKRVDLKKLKENTEAFKLELKNRFSALEGLIEEVDISEANENIVKTIIETAGEIGGVICKKQNSKLSEKTKQLMKRRRLMKVDNQNTSCKIEYVELCKTLRKNMKEDIRKFNCDLVRKTIESNKSLRVVKGSLSFGKKHIIALKGEDGTVTRNREEILRRVEEFYRKLYEGNSGLNEDSEMVEGTAPKILKEEVAFAIKSMKKGRSPGDDGITLDILKEAGEHVEDILAKFFTKCLNSGNIPNQWDSATVILLHKKGDKEDLKNYRPISLLPAIYKIFTKVLTYRLQKKLDAAQPREQAGFRSGFSTVDHIQVLRELIERTHEYELPLCVAFIDYEKAFDSIKTSAVINSLRSADIEEVYIDMVKCVYKNASAKFRLHKDTKTIKIGKGVRQGDTISPKLFTSALQMIFHQINWNNRGIKINGEYLNHLRFADDIVIFSTNPSELQDMVQELSTRSKEVGLKMNLQKTKIMFNNFVEETKIQVDNIELEIAESYIYLGQLISMDGNIMKELNRRIKLGWSAFGRNSFILKGKLPLCLKRKVFNQCVLPVLSYGSETWSLTVGAIRKLQTTQRSMERCMLGITRRDRKRNTWVREQTRVEDIIVKVKGLKWRWAGHIARRTDQRWTTEILNWIPRDHRRPRKRPQTRWVDEIRKQVGVTWKRIAQDRLVWKAFGETFIQQWIDNG